MWWILNATFALFCVQEAEPHLVKQAEEEMATLEHEIDVIKKLRHKHIVGYVAAQRISRTEMYVFLEYVPGGSISSMLKVRSESKQMIRLNNSS